MRRHKLPMIISKSPNSIELIAFGFIVPSELDGINPFPLFETPGEVWRITAAQLKGNLLYR